MSAPMTQPAESSTSTAAVVDLLHNTTTKLSPQQQQQLRCVHCNVTGASATSTSRPCILVQTSNFNQRQNFPKSAAWRMTSETANDSDVHNIYVRRDPVTTSYVIQSSGDGAVPTTRLSDIENPNDVLSDYDDNDDEEVAQFTRMSYFTPFSAVAASASAASVIPPPPPAARDVLKSTNLRRNLCWETPMKLKSKKKVKKVKNKRNASSCADVCYQLADDLVTGQKKALLVIGVMMVTVFGALSGLMIGFTILDQMAPSSHFSDSGKHEGGSSCAADHVTCGDFGCVHIRHVCSVLRHQCPVETVTLYCPDVNDTVVLPATKRPTVDSSTVPVEYVTIAWSLEEPVKDEFGWVAFSGGSANGSRYTVLDKSMTFLGAQDQCRRHAAHLVHVNSVREQVFLEEYLKQELQREDGLMDGVGFWIGARRPRGSHSGSCMYDQWKWTDAYGQTRGTITGFSAFGRGKPDNYYTPEECLYMSYSEGTDEDQFLKWDDAPCDLGSIGGIKILCEAEQGH